nr:hypothetical protein [Actinomycetota bacterium]
RQGLRLFVDAMNRLEDIPDSEVAHFRADEGGEWVRRTFECHLHYEDGRYEHRCPVAIGHKRIGMSVGIKNVRRICSVCGQDPIRCRHIAGRTYRAPPFRVGGQRCNVCDREECEHQDGEVHGVRCWRLVTHADLEEISLVPRPANPDTRLTGLPGSTRDLSAVLGPLWKPGMPVNCDRCLTPCNGVEEIGPLTVATTAETDAA